ncbi:LGR4 [Branchiostoma lanceolatum]|uniref:LGR4 protein n=1 Tax=Branchiostoma lanceolatum TaxID=7740 RepID=A0A8J9ZRM4_BRALA|nr:LGR4 [Branchiostoma lanceolatum]
MDSATFCFIFTLLTTTEGNNFHYTGHNLTRVPIDSITPDAHTVRLSDNEISHLGSFNTTPYIRHLYIDNNRVNNLSSQTFQRLNKLRLLDLNRNYIGSLRDFVFSDLVSLWTLYLSNNLVSAISERAFHGLASLEFLELSGNRLSAVPMQAIRLIPSKRLLLVSLMVNNINQIPEDIQSAHPSASYELQGNPLRCPDEQVSRDDVFNLENVDVWPKTPPYITNTHQNRSFVEHLIFIKSRHKYFGVLPYTFYVSEHYSTSLPLFAASKYNLPGAADSLAWTTPTGRHMIEDVTEALVVENFSAEDSGIYTMAYETAWLGSTKTYCNDLLLCLADRRPVEKQEQNTTTFPPPDDFLPRCENNTDTCASSTNRSCCSYWLRFKSSFHQKFCVVRNTNSEENPAVLSIIAIVLVAMLFPIATALFCWTKRRNSREKNNRASGATLHMGVEAMAVCIPPHTLPELTGYSTERESSPNAFPLRRLRSPETDWSAKKMGATQYSFHCVAEALPADTLGTTEAQVHHYENDDAEDADEEVQCHQYASAAPPPLPVYEGNATDAVNTDVHCQDDEVPEQPAFQIGKAETDETEMPYGVAAANSLYRRDTALNRNALTSEHTSNPTSNDSAVETNQMEEMPYAIADADSLYPRDTVPNRRILTSQHARGAATNYRGTEATQTPTVTADFFYGQQSDHIDMSRDVTMTSCQDSAEPDFGILYGSGPATVE